MDKLTQELENARRRLAATKYILFAALLLWSLGLFFSGLVAFIILAVLTTLWGVTTYIAYMHYWGFKKRSPRN
jgi:hypothetical protein